MIIFAIIFILWALIPGIRAVRLVANIPRQANTSSGAATIPLQSVRFTATDGVQLAGWLAIASSHAPTILLVPGMKGTHTDMYPWANFLYHGGYSVFLLDDRGTGQSSGWNITLGAKEPDDILGAIQYLKSRSDLPIHSYGALGVSIGAGIVILAAAREPLLKAIIADSSWPDLSAQIVRMNSVHLFGPITLPVLPYELPLTNALIGATLQNVRPIDAIAHLSPCAVLLIHSADDQNQFTPLSGEQQLYAAAQAPKFQWIAPHGGHIGALLAFPTQYQQHVLAFLAAYLPIS